MTPREAAHYRVLRLIEEQPEISQRELARVLGVSLGKTHYLMKALLEKGLVKASNFRRSDNKLAYAYLLTPSGIAAKLDLTRRFLRLKEDEYRAAHDEIERLRQELDTAAQPEASVGRASARQQEGVGLKADLPQTSPVGRASARQNNP